MYDCCSGPVLKASLQFKRCISLKLLHSIDVKDKVEHQICGLNRDTFEVIWESKEKDFESLFGLQSVQQSFIINLVVIDKQ